MKGLCLVLVLCVIAVVAIPYPKQAKEVVPSVTTITPAGLSAKELAPKEPEIIQAPQAVQQAPDDNRSRWDRLRAAEKRDSVTGIHRSLDSYTKDELASKVTLVIKTFERPSCVIKYLETIRNFYPNLPILVADDSQDLGDMSKKVTDLGAQYFPLPFDTGVGAGRNFLVDKVETPFFILSDDDNIFTGDTKLEAMLMDIEVSGADIVGGCNSEGDKNCIGDWDMFYSNKIEADSENPKYSTLQIVEVPHAYKDSVQQRNGAVDDKSPHCKEADMVANFFIARTAYVSEHNRWDPYFKVGEHEDFFYRAKLSHAGIRFCTSAYVQHEHHSCLLTQEQSSNYQGFRERIRGYMTHFFEKHSPITRIEMPWATVSSACDDAGCHAEWDDFKTTKNPDMTGEPLQAKINEANDVMIKAMLA